MNFISNKNFYQRIERLDSRSLQNIKRGAINKNEVTACSSKMAYFKENESFKSFSNTETTSFRIPKSTESSKTNKTMEPAMAPANHTTNVDTTNSNCYVITVITEGRGFAQGEVGIASIDINSPILLLSQFSDEVWYNGFITKISLLQPNEIIIPYTIYNSDSKIVNAIKENFSNTKLIPLPRRHFNTEDGLTMINELCSTDCKTLIKFIEKRYYTVAAASALLKYLKQILMINFIKGGLKIEYQAKCGRMLIDHDTCHRLELLYPNCQTKQKKSCLFGILDHTVTIIGKRQLRAKILEPFFDLQKILYIQESVKELINDPKLLLILEERLQKFWNIDKVLKIVIMESQDNKTKSVEIMFDKILLLKSILEQIPELADCLRQCKSTIFMESYNVLMDERYSVMLTIINDVIRPEAQFCRGTNQHFNRIQAIQDDVDKMLDFARAMYTNLIDAVQDVIKELALQSKLPLRMMYMTTKGFYMQLNLRKNNSEMGLPSNTTVFYRKGNILHLTCPELIKLNIRITEVVNEIYDISDKILRELIAKITQYIDANHYLIGVISNLDIFQSYAKVSLNDEFCCPDFGEEIKIKDAVHPLLEYSRTKSTIVRNNIIATPEYNMFIITGPNMGGKTVYIKMIATLQIMAQLGCFIPARKATFKLCDRIFTRIGYEDTTDQNGSSFEIEIREIEYIFKSITPNSLVIIDELCRSTNPIDGKKIAKKICEKFSTLKGYKNYEEETEKTEENEKMDTNSINLFKSSLDENNEKIQNLTAPFIFITTHFIHLTQLSDKYLNVINLHVEAQKKFIDGIFSLDYTHKVKEGVTPIKGYGISLAHNVQLNESIISRAYEILNDYTEIRNEDADTSDTASFFMNKIFTNFEKTLNQSSTSFLVKNNSNVSLISNFINNTTDQIRDQHLQENSSNLQNISTRQLLSDVQSKLYDTYAELAEFFRNKKSSTSESNLQNDDDDNVNQKITKMIDNLITNLPKPLLTEILKDIKTNKNEMNEFEESLREEQNNFDLKDKSNPSTTRSTTITANTTATTITTTATITATTSANVNNDDSNVNWSKLYPDMSFHSFMRKLANGDITIPQNSFVKKNTDDLQQKPSTSSSSPSSSSSRKNLPPVEILDDKIINTSVITGPIDPRPLPSNYEEIIENPQETVLDLSKNKRDKSKSLTENNEQEEFKQKILHQKSMKLRKRRGIQKYR